MLPQTVHEKELMQRYSGVVCMDQMFLTVRTSFYFIIRHQVFLQRKCDLLLAGTSGSNTMNPSGVCTGNGRSEGVCSVSAHYYKAGHGLKVLHTS